MVPHSDFMKLYQDPLWQECAAKIRERDDYTCQRCGRGRGDGVPLHVHHRKYTAAEPWNEPPENLETLCADCHPHGPDPTQWTIDELRSRVSRLRSVYAMAGRLVSETVKLAEEIETQRTAP